MYELFLELLFLCVNINYMRIRGRAALQRLAEDINKVVRIYPSGDVGYQLDIGKGLSHYGFHYSAPHFMGVSALAPIERGDAVDRLSGIPLPAMLYPREMKFKDYVQLDSGLAVPHQVAEELGINHDEWGRRHFSILSDLLDIKDFKEYVEGKTM